MCRLVCAFSAGCKTSTKILCDSTIFLETGPIKSIAKGNNKILTQMDLDVRKPDFFACERQRGSLISSFEFA